jgi:hypothetical protein
MPNIGFKAKWFFVEGLPAAAALLFLLFHGFQVVRTTAYNMLPHLFQTTGRTDGH